MKRANTSLPVPDSPAISTVQSLAATRRARSLRRRETSEKASMSSSDAAVTRDSPLVTRSEADASCPSCSRRSAVTLLKALVIGIDASYESQVTGHESLSQQE